MYPISFLFVATLVGIAQAQTPSGFSPATNTKLDVIFNTTTVKEPGELLSKADTASQPRIAIAKSAVTASDTYVFVMLDLDVPGRGGNTTRQTLLHAMNTGFKATQQSIGEGVVLLASTDKGPAAYIGPSPPAADTIPHRYTQLLFKQPESLKVSATDFANTQARIGFDIEGFATKMGLGSPLAGNFFTVDGKASASSAKGTGKGSPSASGGGAKNTAEPFTGEARVVSLPWGMVGLLGGLAVVGM